MRLFLLSVLPLFGKRIFGRGSLIYGNGPGSQSSLVAVLAEYHFVDLRFHLSSVCFLAHLFACLFSVGDVGRTVEEPRIVLFSVHLFFPFFSFW